ncbi:EamA family transporter [Patescibacteria group bacterium]|nr:EamA family transporter [Patescibacteria group bacterium]MBU1721993.1 EamA family transporter [Patescibacteria group bacterium]MBU1901257.1 EamA family transporter [Patescibacteria group bacterium]
MWILYALGAAFFAALVAIFGKLGISNIDSTVATALRSIIMSVVLVFVVLSIKQQELQSISDITSKEWLFLVLAGLAGALSWICYFAALKTGDATKVVVLDRLSVVFVLLLSVLFLHEVLTWKLVTGVLLMIGGVLLML